MAGTFTYDAGAPTTDLSKVRLYLGDTNVDDPLLYDEEIATWLDTGTNLYTVAADCCLAIIAKLARDVDRSGVGVTASRSQQMTHYQDLEKRLRRKAIGTAGMYASGLTEAELTDYKDDDDARHPLFDRDLGGYNG